MIAALALVLGLLVATPQAADDAAAAALDRCVAELPRADPGTWAELVEAIAAGAGTAGLAAELQAGLARIEARYRERDYPAALAEAYALLEAAPDLPPALLLLGHCLYGLGRYEPAAEQYRAVLEVLPGSVHARRGLGLTLYQLGELDAARAEFELALAAEAGAHEVLEALARCELDLGDPERALELLEAARRSAPHSVRNWFLTRVALEDLERFDEADAVAAVWERMDELAQAERAVAGEVLFAPRDPERLASLSLLRAALGDVSGGRSALARALGVAPPAERAALLERMLQAVGEARARLPRDARLAAWRSELLQAYGAASAPR